MSGPRDSSGSDLNGVLSSVDLVQGKGKGLIILLHGEPGVGKTSTAECVAAHTQRPLFPITCGDIGHLPEDVEANLEQNFQLAHKWGCVLLLDEAEVGKIDTAFKSRIHLTLYYRRLNKVQTLQIWENNLRRVDKEFAKENKKLLFDEEKILKYAETHFKGLKKSKSLSTAIAIATYEAREKGLDSSQGGDTGDQTVVTRLGVAHFKKVAKSARQFDEYLIELNSGSNDSELAKMHTLRHDEFEESGSDGDNSEGESRERHKKRKTSKRGKKGDTSSESGSDASSSSSDSGESKPKKKRRKRQ
ncbi:hypothetical protein Daus18300_011964 [Diaporthe australafricana]|uniref:AAA+ ATPase domain-containing protein n=1 Tax=Diaporthe australafricana TaxID=127596 RepID=A0ABR3W4P2_9PEZI